MFLDNLQISFIGVGGWVKKEQNTLRFRVLKIVFQTQNFLFY